MNKRLFSLVGLLALSVGSLFATTSDFRTPLSFLQKPRTYVHYPLFNVDECDDWVVDGFGLYYQRNACEAFDSDCPNECENVCKDDNDKTTTRTTDLANLWFGRSSFTVEDAFADGRIDEPVGNPFVRFSRLNPQFDYNEKGAALGITVNRYNLGCDKSWFVSGRVALPIKRVEVNQRRACDCEERTDDFADAIVTVQQQYSASDPGSGSDDSRTVRAYRLDLLDLLALPDGTPMVQYGTQTGNTTGNTRVAGQDITNNSDQYSGGQEDRAPMYVYKQSSGEVPYPPKGLNRNDALFPEGQNLMVDDTAQLLSESGNGMLADGDFAFFGGFDPNTMDNDQQSYAGNLGNSVTAQSQLFLVPVSPSSATQTWEPVGLAVQNTIDRVIEDLLLLDEGAVDYLRSKGVDFGRSDCVTGAGDTFIDVWGGRMCDCWFADGVLGFRLPTGTDSDPKRIFEQATGNNGHFATKLGFEAGYRPCDWMGAKLEFFWRHMFNHVEKRAAAFKGANVRNIGPCLDTRTNWDDFQIFVDFTFFSPRCPNVGWDVGYYFWAKTKDDVCFCTDEYQDWNGQTKQLDSCSLEKDTDSQVHKVRAEVFNEWNCFQVFFGGSYNFAGKNVMKETMWYLGMKAYF